MKLLSFIFCCCISLCSINVQAQPGSLTGTYVHEISYPNGQTEQISFILQPHHKAVYKKENAALEQELVKDNGAWQCDGSKQTITVTMPAFKDEAGESYPGVKVIFKVEGANLKVLSASPPATGRKGDIFKKAQEEGK
ncbi:hypothetical protein [Taibaiella koreensis]|uniref:hypothetical protein n=1 Tax=Taibaiella koreensis TaxID=1268548 RepID=UPI000E59B831|nr:hypothetical protein [Taibaiella koreensis]